MAGQRGLDRDARRLAVADLPHHDHVGVLPQDGAQGLGEAEPGPRVDLHVVDARQLALHRILDGDQVALRLVQLSQQQLTELVARAPLFGRGRGQLGRAEQAGVQQHVAQAPGDRLHTRFIGVWRPPV